MRSSAEGSSSSAFRLRPAELMVLYDTSVGISSARGWSVREPTGMGGRKPWILMLMGEVDGCCHDTTHDEKL